MILLTPRDVQIIELIEKFKCLNTEQIHSLVYPNITPGFVRNRLKILTDRKDIKRCRWHIDQQYIYYMGKTPQQIQHKLRLVDVYGALGMPETFETEYVVKDGHLRADGYTEIEREGKLYSFFVEIHQFNGFNFDKYIDFYNSGVYKEYFHIFPRVLIVTDKKLKMPESSIKFILIKNDMSNIGEAFI